MGYKKGGSKQQYALRKRVKSTVKDKLKKNKGKAKTRKKQTVLTMPQTLPAAAEEEVKLPPGFKAKLHYNSGNVKITADVRYETEKTDPLVKGKKMCPKGEI